MNTFSKLGKRRLTMMAAVVGMIVAGSISALAVPSPQVFVAFNDRILSGICCSSWDDTITVTEPAKVAPVVVTFSGEYWSGGVFYAGLSVNGGPCTAYGSRSIDPYHLGNTRRTLSLQWVVKPSDGLLPGTNTFTLCGGAAPSNPNLALILGFRTLAAELGK